MKHTTSQNWTYGKMMVDQEDIASLDDWSDDKEYCFSVMDQKLDYLWSIQDGKIHFIDRLYSDYKNNPITFADYAKDQTMMERIKHNEAELWFDNYDEVRKFINSRS